jgi:hypothetical protein
MKLHRIAILLGALWCTYCLGISLLGAAVALWCVSPDIPTCGFTGYQVGSWWARAAWFAVPLFAAGTFYGFRSVYPDIKDLIHRLRLARKRV